MLNRFRSLIVAAGLVALPVLAHAADSWKIDASHSSVGFTVRHLISRVPGHFGAFGGTIQFDGKDVSTASVEVEIDAASVDTNHEDRDKHLQSPDFFDVANHPKITFKSTGFKAKDATSGQMTGNLTIRGVTKPVTLDYLITGIGKDPWGNEKAGFEAKGVINRKDYNVNWNKTLDNGGLLVSEDVNIEILIEAARVKPEAK